MENAVFQGRVDLVCSNKGRPTVQTSNRGNQWWVRDVHHVKNVRTTLCGRPIGDWLFVDNLSVEKALESIGLCERCAAKLRQATAQPGEDGATNDNQKISTVA